MFAKFLQEEKRFHFSLLDNGGVAITDDYYDELLSGQSAGKHIVAGADGKPVLADPPLPTAEQLAASARLQRDALIAASDWIVARHRDQVDGNAGKTSISSAQYTQLMSYRQALRDWPQSAGFPASPLPAAPDWLASIQRT